MEECSRENFVALETVIWEEEAPTLCDDNCYHLMKTRSNQSIPKEISPGVHWKD